MVVLAVEVNVGRKSNSKRREGLVLWTSKSTEKKVRGCKIKNTNFEFGSINSKFFYVRE